MSRLLWRFLLFFGFLSMLLALSITQISHHYKSDTKALQRFVRATTMGDGALYSNYLAVRYYTLVPSSTLWDDPFLPPTSGADFVYRLKR